MTQQKIKLPRSSYEELRKIIMAYWKIGEPATLDQVSQLSTLERTRISHNNAFLSEIGVIEGGKYKLISSTGSDLASALEHGVTDGIRNKWAVIVNENEFLSKMLQAIGIRGGMEVSELETHIAYSAGESNTPAVMTGARSVVEILRESGLITEHEGRISISDVDKRTYRRDRESIETEEQLDIDSPKTIETVKIDGSYPLTIQLRINVTPDELDGLGEKIQDLINYLSSKDNEN